MTSRERVLTVLKGEIPDRVPWMEGIVGNGIASAVCGERINVHWAIAPDGFRAMSGAQYAGEQKKVNRVFGKDNINFNTFAPIFAYKMEKDPNSPVIVGDGMIRSRDDFERIFKLPPVDDPIFVESAREFVTHSDGDMTPLLDLWLQLGQVAIHPIQPDVMDINEVKALYGNRVTIVGNISMDDLVRKQPSDIEAQVKERIETVGKGGRYIISSSNSLTDDMKPENVRAIISVIDRYG